MKKFSKQELPDSWRCLRLQPRASLVLVLVLVIFCSFVWVTFHYGDTKGIAVLGVFAVAAFRLLPAIGRIMTYLQNIKSGLAPLEYVEADVLAANRKIDGDRMNALNSKDTVCFPGSDKPLTFASSLSLQNISFSFPKADIPAIDDVSLSIKRGECIGLVGESGGGKSTLVDIMLGFLEPSKGSVCSDGLDITANPSVWQGLVGYVPQSVFLLDSSIRENVAFGVPENEIDDNAVRTALRKAQILDFIETLPNGARTLVGERGVGLSGGKRQRL